MHIEVNIFPDHFPIDPTSWKVEMINLQDRITELMLDATVDAKSYALGKTTLLANDDSGIIIATVDIRRS